MDERTVKELMEFIHPGYTSVQEIFINKNMDRMVEVLVNKRTFIYKRGPPVPGKPENFVRWEMIRRIFDYPVNLTMNEITELEFFTPDFSRYMITDRQSKEFLVKDAYLNKVTHRIPKEIMTFSSFDKATLTFNRFKWLSHRTFIIVNDEGFEKIVDIDNGYAEVAFNYRPLIDQI